MIDGIKKINPFLFLQFINYRGWWKMIAVYPGSFDPPTHGHLNLIERASGMFDSLVVAVLTNPQKKSLLTVGERVDIIKKCTVKFSNVQVEHFEGLTTDFLEKLNAHILVRGLRAPYDLEYEMQMASVNHHLNPKVETVYLPARDDLTFISSSICKEVAAFGGDISIFVPKVVEDLVRLKFNRRDF